MCQGESKEPHGSSSCDAVAMERNRYFTGKYMVARDFTQEQEYFLSHHRLHNRLLHGWGIACGLNVKHHPSTDCAARWVVVKSGIAIDCHGREVILDRDTPFELPLPRYDLEKGDPDAIDEPFLLCIEYKEALVEYVPALYNDGDCDPKWREASRIRESWELIAIKKSEVEPDCWRTSVGGHSPCLDSHDDEIPGPDHACLKAVCPCKNAVPLALITPVRETEGFRSGFKIDRDGRRHLPTSSEYLTHIVHTSWNHGQDMDLQTLREAKGRLVVTFDRKLMQNSGLGTGISPQTFVVEYSGIQQNKEFLKYNRKRPPAIEDHCKAVFTIANEHLFDWNLDGMTIHIALRCDFILDCHGNPVDGNHLGGRLPTSGGRPGGVFYSWFRIVRGKGESDEVGEYVEEAAEDQ